MSKQSELVKEISGVNPLKCMKCGKCSASCPAYDEMDIKPHQFVSYVQHDNIEALLESRAVVTCLSCFACVERCPRDVQPGKIVDAVRQTLIRQREKSLFTPEDVQKLASEDEEIPQQLLAAAFRKYRR